MSNNPRLCAVKACSLVVSEGMSLPSALSQSTPELSSIDKGFCQELAFGMLRFYHQYQTLLSQWLDKPIKDIDVELIIISGLYQLEHMRTPNHAATNETVKLAKKFKKNWAMKLINALLRRWIRESEASQGVEPTLPGHSSHPKWLEDKIKKSWPDYADTILQANNQKPPFQLRINANKISRDDYIKLLSEKEIANQVNEHISSALQLDKATDVNQLPGFYQGLVSVQSYAAQWAGYLLDVANGMTILDTCAAPGGKTMHILELAPKAKVTAMDIEEDRLAKVQENLTRIKAKAKLLVGDVTDFIDENQYDRILLDAPCSATGVISRHPDIKLLRRASDIKTLTEIQASAINHIWDMLKPDGILLYATCSVLPEENDQIISDFVGSHADAQLIKIDKPIGIATQYGRQLLPGVHGADGFYYAKMKKAIGQ